MKHMELHEFELFTKIYTPLLICGWFVRKVSPTPHLLKVLSLCCRWGACVPHRSQRLCQLEFWLLVGLTMLDRLLGRGQTKCNTPLLLATSVYGLICRWPCYVMAQPKSRLDIPWPNDVECMCQVWYHFSCWYPVLFDVESLACCVVVRSVVRRMYYISAAYYHPEKNVSKPRVFKRVRFGLFLP